MLESGTSVYSDAMDAVQPHPEPRQGRLALVGLVAVALAIAADVWLLIRARRPAAPPPAESPRARSERLLLQAREMDLAGAPADDVLPLLDQAIDAFPTFAEARLLRIRRALPLYLERWAVLDASPLLDRDRIPLDPTVDRLRTTMLCDAAALGATTIGEEDRVEVAAVEAFLTGEPIEKGTSPRVRALRAWRLLLEGKARQGMEECDLQVLPADPLLRWTLARCLLAVRREEPWHDHHADRARKLLSELRESAAVLCDLAEADPKDATSLLERALSYAPGEASILARLAETAERSGDHAQALAWACQALDAAPDAAGLLLLRARLHARLVQVRAARETYDHARRLYPDRANVLRARAEFLLRTGAADVALGDAERAHDMAPSEDALALVCDALIAIGQPDDALRRCTGTSVTMRRARSRALRALRRYDEAVQEAFQGGAACEAALAALAKGDLHHALQYLKGTSGASRWEILARIKLAEGKPVDALECVRTSLVADPLRAPAEALLGRTFLALGRSDEASEAFARAVEIDPTCAEAWRGMGELHLTRGDTQEALKALDQAVALGHGDPEDFALRARARRRTGDHEGALADVEEALRAKPDHPPWILVRAETKLTRNDAAGARIDAEKACAALPGSADAWSVLAGSALAQGDLDAAAGALEKAFHIDPRHVAARVASARLALARLRRDEARSELDLALDLDPDNADALHLRGRLAVEDARWQEAVDDLERFLERYGADSRAREAAGWLDLARKALRR